MMRLLFTSIFTCFLIITNAQRVQWMALTDCGSLINVRQTCTDSKGNVFTAGEYEGEVLFHSVLTNDTTISKFTSTSWHKSFVARYNSNGKLKLVVQFKSNGGNSNLTYIHALKAMPNGDILVFVRSNGGFDFVDPVGNHVQTGKNGRSDNLFCIDTLGHLRWSVKTPLVDCRWLEVTERGVIYAFGNGQEWTAPEQWLVKYSSTGAPLDTLNTAGPALLSPCFKGSKLYLLCMNAGYGNSGRVRNSKNDRFLLPANNMGLYEFDTADFDQQLLFNMELPMKQYNQNATAAAFRSCINYTSDNLYLDLLIEIDYGTVTFMGKTYADKTQNKQLIRLDKNGAAKQSVSFSAQHYNSNIVAAPGGGLYVFNPVYGPSFKFGNDSLAMPAHTQFIDELVLFRLDASYKRVWWYTAGGTASNYHTTLLTTGKKNELYLASDLMAPGKAFDREIQVPWRCVAYLVKVGE